MLQKFIFIISCGLLSKTPFYLFHSNYPIYGAALSLVWLLFYAFLIS